MALFVLRTSESAEEREVTRSPPPPPATGEGLPLTPTLLTCTECWSEIPQGQELCPTCEGPTELGLDRRSSPRVPVQFPVIYSSGKQSFRGVARDLGLSGVFVACNRFDPEVTPCQVILLPDSEQAFSVVGVVSRVGAYDPDRKRLPGLGIKFTDVPDDAMTWIHATVEAGGEWVDSNSTS
jgi:hypothetical protein